MLGGIGKGRKGMKMFLFFRPKPLPLLSEPST